MQLNHIYTFKIWLNKNKIIFFRIYRKQKSRFQQFSHQWRHKNNLLNFTLFWMLWQGNRTNIITNISKFQFPYLLDDAISDTFYSASFVTYLNWKASTLLWHLFASPLTRFQASLAVYLDQIIQINLWHNKCFHRKYVSSFSYYEYFIDALWLKC